MHIETKAGMMNALDQSDQATETLGVSKVCVKVSK